MKGVAPAVIRHKQVLEHHPLIVEQLIGPGRALQGREREGITFKSIHSSLRANASTGDSSIEADVGTDIQHHRTGRQKCAKYTNDIVLVVPAEQSAERLSILIAKAQIFAAAPAHE